MNRFMTVLALASAMLIAVTATADDKKKVWTKGECPVYKTDDKTLQADCTVENNTIVLANRGIAVSTAKYDNSYGLTFTWTGESGDNDKYPDILAVALRSDGKLQKKWAGEIDNGLVVQFGPAGKTVAIHYYQNGKAETLKTTDKVDLTPKNPHKVKIWDSQTSISVEVDGKEVLKVDVKKDAGDKAGKIAVYNREPVGPNATGRKESKLTDVTINLP